MNTDKPQKIFPNELGVDAPATAEDAERIVQKAAEVSRTKPKLDVDQVPAPCADPPRDRRAADAYYRTLHQNELRRWGVEKRYLNHSFQTLDDRLPAGFIRMASVLQELLHRPRLAVLSGPRGVGKTALANMLVRHFIEATPRRYAIRANVNTILEEITNAPFEGRRSKEYVRYKYRQADLLVIDEIQSRPLNRDNREFELEELIDARYSAMRATLLVTDLKPDSIEGNVGPRTMRRVLDEGDILIATWPEIVTIIPEAGGQN